MKEEKKGINASQLFAEWLFSIWVALVNEPPTGILLSCAQVDT